MTLPDKPLQGGRDYYFTNKELGTKRGQVTCLEMQSPRRKGWDVNSGLLSDAAARSQGPCEGRELEHWRAGPPHGPSAGFVRGQTSWRAGGRQGGERRNFILRVTLLALCLFIACTVSASYSSS